MRFLSRRLDRIEKMIGIPYEKEIEKQDKWITEFIELVDAIRKTNSSELEKELKNHVKGLLYPVVDMLTFAGIAMRFLKNKYPDIHSKLVNKLRAEYEALRHARI